MEQNPKFGGTFGYGDSYLEALSCQIQVIRLYAILQDAARAVPTYSGKGPGYCYTTGRGPSFCLLGHVTGVFFCLYVKLFEPHLFNSVDFWSIMSCIIVDIELTDKNVINELLVFLTARFRDTHFVLQKCTNPQNKRFGAQETCK